MHDTHTLSHTTHTRTHARTHTYTHRHTHACTHTLSHAQMHTHTHTHQTDTRVHTHSHMHRHTHTKHTLSHKHTHTLTRTDTHTRVHTHSLTCTDAHTHACTHTLSHAQTHTHTHARTHTHTHTQSACFFLWPWSTKPVLSVHFFEIYASSESWLNNISIDLVCNDRTIFENLNIEKIIFKVVQIKRMHITKILLYIFFSFWYIYGRTISSWNMILISNYFCHKRNTYNFTHTMYYWAITTNILCASDCSVLRVTILYYYNPKSVTKRRRIYVFIHVTHDGTHTWNISLNTHDEVSNINSYYTRTASET